MAKIINLSMTREALAEMTEEELLSELKSKGDVKSSQLTDYSVSNLPDNVQLSFDKFDTITDTDESGNITRSVIIYFTGADDKTYKSTVNRLNGFLSLESEPVLRTSRNGNFYIGQSVNPELSGYLPSVISYFMNNDIIVQKIEGKVIPFGTKVSKENYLKKLGMGWLYKITPIEQE